MAEDPVALGRKRVSNRLLLGRRILIAEENKTSRDAIASQLKAWKARCTIVNNAQSAHGRARTGRRRARALRSDCCWTRKLQAKRCSSQWP